jgi:toxin FitB
VNGWLLDTNIISELAKPRPDKKVVSFIAAEKLFWVSVVSLAELERGITAMAHSEKKIALLRWFAQDLRALFSNKIANVDQRVINALLDLGDFTRTRRFSPDAADALIAATALANKLTVATRNIRDFKNLGVRTFNPFTGERCNGA